MKAGLTPKQAEFLCYEGREALYGGAAGGGKSVALLAAALQYVDVPGYAALLMRRTYAQLSKADSILGKAKEWLMPFVKSKGLRWNGDEKKFTFPSGSTLEFGHCENDNSIYNYQGGIWAFIGVDETTQFTAPMLAYPRSRQRRVAGSPIPIRWRGASNPGGIGHDHVRERYVKDKRGNPISHPDRRYFPATIKDNPNIDREEYIRQLKESGIDPLTLAQLLEGDWDAVLGGRFKQEWFGYYHTDPTDRAFIVTDRGERFKPTDRPIWQTCDPSASEADTADQFVVSTWCMSPQGYLIWLDCYAGRHEIDEQMRIIKGLYRRWKPGYIAVEEVLNQRALAQLLRKSTDPFINVKSVNPLGKSKVERATPAIVFVSSRRLLLPDDSLTFPLDAVQGQLLRFTGDDGDPDDIADTLFYSVQMLNSGHAGNGAGFGIRAL